ncbi:TPA: hypothetical protein DEP90_00905 [Patescibacteria group bacterium]|nr:hypothetical protein [Patescibacteria group bacterium]
MEKERMLETTEKEDSIEVVQQRLLSLWVENDLLPKMAKESTNKENLHDILIFAKESKSKIPIITVGCQPMSEVAGMDGTTVSIVPRLDSRKNKRPARWADGITSFQQAMESFGISSHIFLSLSDMELLAQTIDNPQNKEFINTQRMDENMSLLVKMINEKGGSVSSFVHSKALGKMIGADDVEGVVKSMLPNWKGEKLTHTTNEDSTEPLPTALYDADPRLLPNFLLEEDEKRLLIWLDMMSDLATKDHQQLRDSINRNLSNTPLISPATNGGKWDAAGEPVIEFKNKQQFMAQLLGMGDLSIESKREWLVRLNNTVHDEDLVRLLGVLGIEVQIDSMESRVNAVRLIEEITFGSSDFTLRRVKEIQFEELRLKNLVANLGGFSSKQAFILITEGKVKIDGEVVEDINFVPQRGNTVTVGKKKESILV